MGTTGPTSPVTELAELVGGVARDAGRLVTEQMELARAEIGGEVRKAAAAGAAVAAGGGLTAAGGALGGVALVHLASRATGLPLWACYGAAGGLLAAAGVALLYSGRRGLAGVHLLPPPRTAEAARENVAWLSEHLTPAAR